MVMENKERTEIWIELFVEPCASSSIRCAFKLVDLVEAVRINVEVLLKHKERTRISIQ
jgi:hypothetical protein